MRLLQPLDMVPWNRKVYEGEYGSEYLSRYLALGHPRLHVVDIGANSGAFGAYVLSGASVGTAVDYTAFEPQNRLHRCIEVAVPQVQLSGAAVAGLERLPGLWLVNRPGGNPGEWTLGREPEEGFPEGWRKEPVEVALATEVPPCDLLKLDCEGAEALILPNYPHLAEVSYLAYEWHGLEAQRICAEAALKAGLKPVKAVLELDNRGVTCWGR